MRFLRLTAGLVSPLLFLSACATTPMGPTVNVMPNPNKPFDQFVSDQAQCKDYAAGQVQGAAQQANNQQVGTAVIGTVLGAGLGAAIGRGRGAAIGAASGAVAGTAYGAGPAGYAQYSIQQRYDMAYSQCMYSRGDQVPGYSPPPGYAPGPGYPPPPPSGYPPPPPGSYPPGYYPPPQ